jgi:hypothetical protein
MIDPEVILLIFDLRLNGEVMDIPERYKLIKGLELG